MSINSSGNRTRNLKSNVYEIDSYKKAIQKYSRIRTNSQEVGLLRIIAADMGQLQNVE